MYQVYKCRRNQRSMGHFKTLEEMESAIIENARKTIKGKDLAVRYSHLGGDILCYYLAYVNGETPSYYVVCYGNDRNTHPNILTNGTGNNGYKLKVYTNKDNMDFANGKDINAQFISL